MSNLHQTGDYLRRHFGSGVLALWCVVGLGCDRSPDLAAVDEPADRAVEAPAEPAEAKSSQAESGQSDSVHLQANKLNPDKSSRGASLAAWERPSVPLISATLTEPNPDNLLSAKARFERLVPRVTLRSWQRFENLIYEANNLVMRGPRDKKTGLYERGGAQIAATWRRYARGTRGLFVLRDSLFSQQDHPVANDPYAPLLPPNWITAVAHAADTSQAFEVPTLPAIADDAAWRQFESKEQLFGDLPASESLFEAVVGEAPGTNNARDTLHILYRDVSAMVSVIERGPEAVAQVGAERIAASDRAYFGADVRRELIIPIFVENPNPHELDEGKGIDLPGRDVSKEVLQIVLEAVYARRLEDGDLALERYDLSKADERERAISVLETLIPESSDDENDTKLWLWVTGELDPNKKLQGQDARPYVATLREMINAADIDTSRLELFSKPSVELPSEDFEAALERELTSFETLGMAMSIELPTTHSELRETICCAD